MKQFLWLLLMSVLLTPLHAQDELYKYDRIPNEFQQVFNDVGRQCHTVILNTPSGQYWGQTRDGKLYGYGYFLNNNGDQSYGQYREGKQIFALTIDRTTAFIGSPSFYAAYDLATCELRYICKHGENMIPNAKTAAPYRFEALNYSNGDRYVGETYNGARHGYGIYYWNDGRFWYGQYRDNVRDGYGVLFGTDHKIVVGKWLDNELIEME